MNKDYLLRVTSQNQAEQKELYQTVAESQIYDVVKPQPKPL